MVKLCTIGELESSMASGNNLPTINIMSPAVLYLFFLLVDECSSDYTIVLPVIGAIVLGLCAVGLIVYGIHLRRESSGYQRI